jgi:hypothetical protein
MSKTVKITLGEVEYEVPRGIADYYRVARTCRSRLMISPMPKKQRPKPEEAIKVINWTSPEPCVGTIAVIAANKRQINASP